MTTHLINTDRSLTPITDDSFYSKEDLKLLKAYRLNEIRDQMEVLRVESLPYRGTLKGWAYMSQAFGLLAQFQQVAGCTQMTRCEKQDLILSEIRE